MAENCLRAADRGQARFGLGSAGFSRLFRKKTISFLETKRPRERHQRAMFAALFGKSRRLHRQCNWHFVRTACKPPTARVAQPPPRARDHS
jgi:hypothetical protein